MDTAYDELAAAYEEVAGADADGTSDRLLQDISRYLGDSGLDGDDAVARELRSLSDILRNAADRVGAPAPDPGR